MSVSKTRVRPINDLTKSIENIVSLTTVTSGNTTLSNGQGATFTITTVGNSGNRTMAIHDWSLFIGSVTGAHALPDGVSIDMTKWIVVPFINDWASTDNVNTAAKIYVQNVSAGASQVVTLEVQARLIQNSTTIGGSA